ncbi:rod shape-determining protein MreD [Tenacibaculum agarivorans]|uniref:rod shape-determining protein MreD n=1 Tax=Tenacibaculum agarivorans TaxID=1908389 RepID=UPI00094BB492|nr:rod shape-determining protein MreD [Tenacibaculum agarivorans]
MNKRTFNLLLSFIGLTLLQVLILNNILIFGYVNPYLYIIFIFIFPYKVNRFPILFSAFFLGLFVDLFSDSGGIHTFATTTIAYIRPYFFKTFFQKTEVDYEFFTMSQESFGKVFNFIASLTLIHHFIVFLLINFSFNNFLNVIVNTLLSCIFSLILYFVGNFIFRRKQQL